MAGVTTDKSGQLVPRPSDKSLQDKMISFVAEMKPEFARALPPGGMSAERFVRIVQTAIRQTPKIAECSAASVLGSVFSLAQIGLQPNTAMHEAVLIPRSIKGRMECGYIIEYRGIIALATRSDRVVDVQGYVVRDGDTFDYELGTHPDIRHRVLEGTGDTDSRPMTHAYAVARMTNGTTTFRVLTRAQVYARRNRNRYWQSSPWTTDEEAMWCKTAVRALEPWIPKSSDLRMAIALEEAPERDVSVVEVLNVDAQDALKRHGLSEEGAVSTEEPVAEIEKA